MSFSYCHKIYIILAFEQLIKNLFGKSLQIPNRKNFRFNQLIKKIRKIITVPVICKRSIPDRPLDLH